jgi:hypothetical protein
MTLIHQTALKMHEWSVQKTVTSALPFFVRRRRREKYDHIMARRASAITNCIIVGREPCDRRAGSLNGKAKEGTSHRR